MLPQIGNRFASVPDAVDGERATVTPPDTGTITIENGGTVNSTN